MGLLARNSNIKDADFSVSLRNSLEQLHCGVNGFNTCCSRVLRCKKAVQKNRKLTGKHLLGSLFLMTCSPIALDFTKSRLPSNISQNVFYHL